MTPRSLYRRIRKFMATTPPPVTAYKPTPKPKPKRRPAPKNAICVIKDPAKHGIGTRKPDALVEMARDMAEAVLAHPEQYMQPVMGTHAIVVDDATYDALFYLFSGKTRDRLFREDNKVYAIMLHDHTVISQKLLAEAREAERDMGHGGF